MTPGRKPVTGPAWRVVGAEKLRGDQRPLPLLRVGSAFGVGTLQGHPVDRSPPGHIPSQEAIEDRDVELAPGRRQVSQHGDRIARVDQVEPRPGEQRNRRVAVPALVGRPGARPIVAHGRLLVNDLQPAKQLWRDRASPFGRRGAKGLATLRGAQGWRRSAHPPLAGNAGAAGHRRLPVLRGHLSHVRLHHIADCFDER